MLKSIEQVLVQIISGLNVEHIDEQIEALEPGGPELLHLVVDYELDEGGEELEVGRVVGGVSGQPTSRHPLHTKLQTFHILHGKENMFSLRKKMKKWKKNMCKQENMKIKIK